MQPSEIEALVAAALPEANISVQGEGGKYMVSVVSETFAGLNAVKRQQSIYRILNPHISSGAIHAVSMELRTPEEA